MSCKERQQQIVLFLYDELLDQQRIDLQAHMNQCEACRSFYEEERGFHRDLDTVSEARELPANLLVESRQQLQNDLDRIEESRPWWQIPIFSPVFSKMRLLESAALVSMGLAVGVYVTSQRPAAPAPSAVQPQVATIPNDAAVSNLRIISTDPSTGEVELAGEIMQPLRLQGSLEDESVRRLLFSALKSAANPGFRLHAVELLSRDLSDQAVKEALVNALVNDTNPGVRLRALQGLKPLAGEEDVRRALMYSLANDDNAGIRVEVIEALTLLSADDTFSEAIKELTRQDDNAYVRMKALQFVGTPK